MCQLKRPGVCLVLNDCLTNASYWFASEYPVVSRLTLMSFCDGMLSDWNCGFHAALSV